MLDAYGRNNAKWFDRFGFEYFTQSVYDAYYPGYGDSWPAFQGSVGMTFEMASARGLAGERRNGEIVTYADGVQRHFVASIGTIETASVNRRPSCGISLSIDAVRMPASMEAHASM